MSLQRTDSYILPSIHPEVDSGMANAVPSCRLALLDNRIGKRRAPSNKNVKNVCDRTSRVVVDPNRSVPSFGINCSEAGQGDRRSCVIDASDETLIKHVALGDRAPMRMIFVRYRKNCFGSSFVWFATVRTPKTS